MFETLLYYWVRSILCLIIIIKHNIWSERELESCISNYMFQWYVYQLEDCWNHRSKGVDNITFTNPTSKIKPVNPKGNQPWVCIRRTNAEAEVPILWPPDAKSPLIGKDPDAEKDDWMASPIQWTWLWASSGRWWKTGKPGLLQSMAQSQTRLSHWTTVNIFHSVQWYRL